ncbi:MAG TPA: transcription elongation factor subunit Spt4 [Candidatus Nitrosotalea sp.]|jgi:DNA-directed RNA polymerase subunit E"|nr:transcription elongation factor subunit Spt4 [Candidatus Nitrosotalea sp.]
MVRELACRKCKFVTVGKVCPICKSSDLSPDWSSSVLVVDPANSLVAKSLGIKEKGKYALKVT